MDYQERRTQEQEDLENYLKDIHYDLYPNLLDDDIADHYDEWVASLEVDELVEYSRAMCLIPHRRIAQEYYQKNIDSSYRTDYE